MALRSRCMMILFLTLMPQLARAGGPRYVAGVSYFDSGTKGTPLIWAQGVVNYYTDQGDLSPILPHASADAFVGDAFSRWTLISTAAVSATLAGQLGEDVNGTNVFANGDGTVTMPPDILPAALTKPVALVYDADGQVTDALLGEGAGGVDSCFSNAVFGGPDNLSPDAHLVHALVVLNGVCAQTSDQLPDLKYRLVRVLGRVLGLDWSQVNINVVTFSPPPKADDYVGFPVMHAIDSVNCIPIAVCYPNADQPKMDDRAALSRLYPVTAQNQSAVAGKLPFAENTIRVHGSVRFVDAGGLAAQPMQGVNVIARWIDPEIGLASGAYAAASVSGFLFRGNAGNMATGFGDVNGLGYDRFGSDDAAVEGFFDLAGLEIPNSSDSAQYQLSVEAVDPLWSLTLGPYGPMQVQPSGILPPMVVTVSKGGDLQQDLLMQSSAAVPPDWFEPADYASPAAVPGEGEWAGTISGYGNADYFWFAGQMDRTLSVEVTALDESGAASQSKVQPVIGMWTLSNPGESPAPAHTPFAFNTLNFGLSRLDAALLSSTSFRIGISDYRGDGRPDFRYLARVFYGDNVTPARASSAGGTGVAIAGMGFRTNTVVNIGPSGAAVLEVATGRVVVTAPAVADGLQSLALSDPLTEAGSTMMDALIYGAGPDDIIRLVVGGNPAVPVGGEAPNPIVVRVLEADGVTPVAGASVFFTVTPAASLAVCGGAASCTVLTDESGLASTRITVLTAGVMTITAQLAPASYVAPKFVQTTLLGISSALDIAMVSPFAWIAQGVTLDVPLASRVMSNGVPQAGKTVNYQVLKGAGTLSLATTTTDANGYSNTSLHLTALAGDVQVSACVEPGDVPCQNFIGTAVPFSSLRLEPVAGNPQLLTVGQSFQPVIVRVTDSAVPSHPVLAAVVDFQWVIGRAAKGVIVIDGDTLIGGNPMPIILGTLQASVVTDANGLAVAQASGGDFSGALLILGTAAAGNGYLQFALQSLWPMAGVGPNVKTGGASKVQGFKSRQKPLQSDD